MTGPPPVIGCVECGGDAHLTNPPPEDELLEPGTPLAYVCADCSQRLDVVWEDRPE